MKDSTNEFFLRQAKTKEEAKWIDTVPVLERTRLHPKDGLGFSFKSLKPITDVQKPLYLTQATSRLKPSDWIDFIKILRKGGKSQTEIAKLFGCTHTAIQKLLK